MVDACVIHSHSYLINNTTAFKQAPEYAKMQLFFSQLPVKVIKKTFESTTQYARIPVSMVLHKHYKAPFPTLNMLQKDEAIAIDIVYHNTPPIDNRGTSAQIFVGIKTFLTNVYGMKSDKQFIATLSNNIRQ